MSYANALREQERLNTIARERARIAKRLASHFDVALLEEIDFDEIEIDALVADRERYANAHAE